MKLSQPQDMTMNKRFTLIGNILFTILLLIFIISHSWVNIRKFYIFHHSCFGMDIFGTMFWNIASVGKVTIYSVPSVFPVGLTVFFLAPIIYVYYLIYAFSGYPQNLLILQPILIGSGAIPIFLLSRLKIRNYFVPLAISLSYFMHPIIGIGATTGFHPTTTFLVCMLWSFYFLEKKNLGWFLILCIFANFAKPQAAVINIIFSLFLVRNKELKHFGKWLLILSLSWLVLSIGSMVVLLKVITHQEFLPPAVGLYKFPSVEHFLRECISQPGILIERLLDKWKFMGLLFCVFSPLGFLPLLSFNYIIPILPSFVYLAVFPESTELFNIFAFIYFALINTLARFKDSRLMSIFLSCVIIVTSILSRYLLKPPFENPDFAGPLPFSKDFSFTYYKVTRHHLIGRNILKTIMPGSSCLVTPVSLVGHLYKCGKIGIFTVPDRELNREEWDYILVDNQNLEFSGTDKNVVEARIKELLDKGIYNITLSGDGWLLLKKKK